MAEPRTFGLEPFIREMGGGGGGVEGCVCVCVCLHHSARGSCGSWRRLLGDAEREVRAELQALAVGTGREHESRRRRTTAAERALAVRAPPAK